MTILKKAIVSLACSSLLLPSAVLAHGSGDYVTPSAGTPIIWEGVVNVTKDWADLNCIVRLQLDGPNEANDTVNVPVSHTDESHIGATITFIGGDLGCTALRVNRINNVSIDGALDTITLHDTYVHTVLVPGDAEGAITASKDSSHGLTIDFQVVPEVVAGTGDATVAGYLDLVSPAGSVDFVSDNH